MKRGLPLVLACNFALAASAALAGPSGDQSTLFVNPKSGSDAGLCLVGAPCLTLRYALDRAALNAQVFVVEAGDLSDPDTIPITQGVIIRGLENQSVRINGPSNKAAIAISVPPSQSVFLQHLLISGNPYPASGTGSTVGIDFVTGYSLRLNNVTVGGFTAGEGVGVRFSPSNAGAPNAALFIEGSRVVNNSGAHIQIKPRSAGFYATATITRLSAEGAAGDGIVVDTTQADNIRANVSVLDTFFTGIGMSAVKAISAPLTQFCNVYVARTSVQNSFRGVYSMGPHSNIMLDSVSLTSSSLGGDVGNGGQISSFQNNSFYANTTDLGATVNLTLRAKR